MEVYNKSTWKVFISFLVLVKKRNYFNLKNNDKIIIDDDVDLKLLTKKISKECTDGLLDNSKKKLFHLT